MSQPISFLGAQLRGLRRDDADIWQVAQRRVPAWAKERKSPTGFIRPVTVLCVSKAGGAEMVELDGEGSLPAGALGQAVVQASKLRGTLPGRIEVGSEADATEIRPLVEGQGVVVEIEPKLQAIDAVLDELEAALNNGERCPFPPLMDSPGMTLDRVRSFAEAAALFAKAKPWRWTVGEACMLIDPPLTGEATFGCCTAMGELGECTGLAFHRDLEEFDAMGEDPAAYWRSNPEKVWVVWFDEIIGLPMADADLWLDAGLPVAGRAFYPLPHGTANGKTFHRPSPALLTAMEAVLRIYASPSAAERKKGTWTREVATFDGPRTLTLREAPTGVMGADDGGPSIVVPSARGVGMLGIAESVLAGVVGGGRSGKASARERAQQLCYDALEAGTKKKAATLCREALTLDPDCCDALLMLTEMECRTPEQRAERFVAAVAAGERSLGPKVFRSSKGHFWGLLETRPYMRARASLAQTLRDLGRTEEAIGHWRGMLELNPNDNQGVRYAMLSAVLEVQDLSGAAKLWKQYEADASAWWAYGKVLLCLLEKDEEAAAAALREAARVNPFAAAYLSGAKAMPSSMPPYYGFGDEDEAVCAAEDMLPAWRAAPDAQEWLRRHAAAALPPRSTSRTTKKRKPKKE